jgi:hypothetical protein
MHFFRDERGMALGMAMLFMVVVGAGSFYVMNRVEKTKEAASDLMKEQRGRVEAKKAFAALGFAIANNLVLCRQGRWQNGNESGQCRWFEEQSDGIYKPDDFGFTKLRYESGVLTLDLTEKISDVFDRKKNNRYIGQVKLKLVDVSKDKALESAMGEISPEAKLIDNDHYVIMAEVDIDVPDKGDKKIRVSNSAAFKRPISIPTVNVLSSSCLSQCNTSLNEHTSPACRGPFSIDNNTMTEIVAVTTNEGPGVLYGLDYEREVQFASEVKGVDKPGNKKVGVPIGDFIPPGGKVEWVDKVSCGSFVKTVTQYSNSTSGVSRDVSQHSEPAGQVFYKLDTASPMARLEPYRLNEKLVMQSGEFKGKSDTTTVVIYVDPPH